MLHTVLGAMNLLFIFLFAFVLVNAQDLRWQNSYDQALNFNCQFKQSISYVGSNHDNQHEDRVWDFKCQNTFESDPDCDWTPYVNGFDEPFTFQCPGHSVISGMASEHANKHEDRRWKFYCCRVNNYCNQLCQWTTYINNFDEEFHWYVPNQHYLVGVESYHENKYEDRRWKYQYCLRERC